MPRAMFLETYDRFVFARFIKVDMLPFAPSMLYDNIFKV